MMKILTGTVLALGFFLVGAGDLSAQKKETDCCAAKMACCTKPTPSACCVAQTRLGCCEQGMKCCADNRGCCVAVQACCTKGAECCKQDKACCGPKTDAKLGAVTSDCCKVASATTVAKGDCCKVASAAGAKKAACCDAEVAKH